MAQLFGAFGLDLKLLIAQLINFGILLVVLTYVLYKPVMKTISERQKKIAQGVEDAARASEKLQSADEEAATVVRNAETEAEGIVSTAREAASSEKARIVKDAESRAAAISADADARAKESQERALRESEKEIARLAILAAEKSLRSN